MDHLEDKIRAQKKVVEAAKIAWENSPWRVGPRRKREWDEAKAELRRLEEQRTDPDGN